MGQQKYQTFKLLSRSLVGAGTGTNPDAVDLTFIYPPNNFDDRSWLNTVKTEHYFCIIIDPLCTKIYCDL